MAYPQPTGGLIQRKIDINTASDPPSGSMYIGVDTDGTLKLRDEFGVVHPVGGSGSGSVTGTPSQIAYFDNSGLLTGDPFFLYSATGGTEIKNEFLAGGNTVSGVILISNGVNIAQDFNPGVSLLSINQTLSQIGVVGPGWDPITGSISVSLNFLSTNNSFKYLVHLDEVGVHIGNSTHSQIWPLLDGQPGQVMTTDGLGNLTFSSGFQSTTFLNGTYSITQTFDMGFDTGAGFTVSGIYSTDSIGEVGFSGMTDLSSLTQGHGGWAVPVIGSTDLQGGVTLITTLPSLARILTSGNYSTQSSGQIILKDNQLQIKIAPDHTNNSGLDIVYGGFQLQGATSGINYGFATIGTFGNVGWYYGTQSGSNYFKFPITNGVVGQTLINDGSGNLHWGVPNDPFTSVQTIMVTVSSTEILNLHTDWFNGSPITLIPGLFGYFTQFLGGYCIHNSSGVTYSCTSSVHIVYDSNLTNVSLVDFSTMLINPSTASFQTISSQPNFTSGGLNAFDSTAIVLYSNDDPTGIPTFGSDNLIFYLTYKYTHL